MNRCNNCGKATHTYRNCRVPITSNGIIHIHRSKYLLICRKKTLGYVDFIRGKYTLTNPSYILNLIDEMTVEEKKNLLTMEYSDLSIDLWGSVTDDVYPREKFNALRRGVLLKSQLVTLKGLVEASTTAWAEPEWGFPKGRRNSNESELNCALREYSEETGYNPHDLSLVANLMPFEEIFIGSNYKAYKHQYYLAFNAKEAPTRPFQPSEVSAMRLFTYEEAMAAIRPYNVERKTILSKVHQLLNEYFEDNILEKK